LRISLGAARSKLNEATSGGKLGLTRDKILFPSPGVSVALWTQSSQRIHRFGAFEADLWTGELRKDGVRLKVQEQPLKILAMLLAQPGELVTRERLREGLWSIDTFVDFDRGLNTSVNRLRAALGDSAEKPRFVETVGSRGYRFIAPVANGNGQAAAPSAAVVPFPSQEYSDQPRASTERKSEFRWKVLTFGGAFLIMLVIAVGVRFHMRQTKPLTDTDTVLLADFTNTTGDAVFDGSLRQGLSVQL
jgi:DNA-binding winged helix-turn-helix (wHTH) protein